MSLYYSRTLDPDHRPPRKQAVGGSGRTVGHSQQRSRCQLAPLPFPCYSVPMPSVPVDSYRLVTLLKERGFTEAQAGGIVEVLQEVDLSNFATRWDLKEMELSLERDLKELELRMTIKLGSLIVAGTGALAALQILR
jgi:hypothetical protein